jgi:hypothetical protein
MYSRLGTIVAVLMGTFPFFALGYKIFEVSTTAIVVYAAILVILVAGLAIAPRLNLIETAADASDERAPRPQAAPIEWSWDGVNRGPEDE